MIIKWSKIELVYKIQKQILYFHSTVAGKNKTESQKIQHKHKLKKESQNLQH